MYMARMGQSETIQPGNRDSDTTQKDNDAFLQLSIARFKGWDYEQMKKFGPHAGQPGHRHGVELNTE